MTDARIVAADVPRASAGEPSDMVLPAYRQDRSGEAWHIIPVNEHGPRGRALCGEPRQGTRLSELLAPVAPAAPASVCPTCLDRVGSAG